MGNDEFKWIKGKITSNLNEFEPAIKRARTFWLTVSTSLLSVLAIVIATLQLTDDKISRIKEFLESIANFFI